MHTHPERQPQEITPTTEQRIVLGVSAAASCTKRSVIKSLSERGRNNQGNSLE